MVIQILPNEEEATWLPGDTDPILKLRTLIFLDAIRKRASDIYLIERAKGVDVRFKIDSAVRSKKAPPRGLFGALTDSFKQAFGLVEEREVPLTRWEKVSGKKPELETVVRDLKAGDLVSGILKHDVDKKTRINLTNLPIGKSQGYHIELFYEMPDLSPLVGDFIQGPGLYLVSSPPDHGKTSFAYHLVTDAIMRGKLTVSVEQKPAYVGPVDGVRMSLRPDDSEMEGKLRGLRDWNPDFLFIDDVSDPRMVEEAMFYAKNGKAVVLATPAAGVVGSIDYLARLGANREETVDYLRAATSQRLVSRLDPRFLEAGGGGEISPDDDGYLGMVPINQVLNSDNIGDVKKALLSGKVPGDDYITPFSKLVEPLVEGGITTKEEAGRVGRY